MTAIDTSPYLVGQLRPRHGRADRLRPAGDRRAADRTQRALPAQRPEPDATRRPGDASLVHRRRHGARHPAARGQGRVVPQPLRRRPPPSARAAACPTSPAATGTAAWARPEHQRRRLRRHDVGDGRGRRLPGRADLRARHRRPQRLLRHAARRLHRPPQGRPGHRRDARDGLRLGAVDGPRPVRRRRQGRPGAAARSTSRCRA